jgi:hypothetical protein
VGDALQAVVAETAQRVPDENDGKTGAGAVQGPVPDVEVLAGRSLRHQVLTVERDPGGDRHSEELWALTAIVSAPAAKSHRSARLVKGAMNPDSVASTCM